MDFKQNNNKAVIYARYSCENQTEQSIEGQVRVIKEYATRNQIQIIDIYVDRAISGTSDKRPQFQKLIADAKKKNFGYVLVYKYDRFSRDRLNSLLYKRELRKNGVRVVSVTEYISDDPQGILFESIIDGYSEYYSAELSQKVRRGNRESRIKGQCTGGRVLYGYTVYDKKYYINEEEAKIVRRVFEMAAEGIVMEKIADILNKEGITRKGNIIKVSFIHKLVKNKRYMGIVEIHDEVFKNIFPPIVDEELYKRANFILCKNKVRGGHYRSRVEYLLSGKLYCGYCGERVTSECATTPNGTLHYYKCATRKRKRLPCELKTFRKDNLEELVISKINKLILNDKNIDKISDYIVKAYNSSITENEELKENERKIEKNKKEIENLLSAITSGIFNNTIKEKLDALEKEKEELHTNQDKLRLRIKNKITKEDAIHFLKSLLDKNTNPEAYKKRIIQRFVNKIVLYNDKIELHLIAMHEIIDLDQRFNNNHTLIESNSNHTQYYIGNGTVMVECTI